jgi:gibberellin A4 carboxyl methyltransferase
MPSLSGMRGEGHYDRHSSVQGAALDAVSDWIDVAVAGLPLPDEPTAITIADYGCSEGRNSITAVSRTFDALRRRRPTQALCAMHTDLPGNNFNRLFTNLHDPSGPSYLFAEGTHRPNVYALAAAGSFYGPVLPPRSVSFGLSFYAILWLDRRPAVSVPGFVGYMRSTPEAARAFAEQAERDLTRFLECRAAELVPGGKLLLVAPGQVGMARASDGLYDVLDDACRDLMAAGRIDPDRYERFAFPVYFRSQEETCRLLDRPESRFYVERSAAFEAPMPIVEQYRHSGDVDRYATDYTNFLRAFSEPVIVAGMADARDATFAEAFYERVRQRVRAEPERYLYRNLVVAVLLTRT